MSDNKNVISFNKPAVQSTSQPTSPIRAKFFKVTSANQNYSQYLNTIKAYSQAGMPFEHIANAGEFIGDQVEKGEIDSSLIEGWQEKAGEIAEEESKVLAWQNRGEVISVTHQLPSAPTTGQEITPLSQDLTTQKQPQSMNVLEGISVYNQQPQSLPNISQNQGLENNPFLTAPPVIKK